jgi:hypothetical protein
MIHILSFHGSTGLVDLGFLYEVPRSYSVGVLWTSNRLVAETDNRQHSQEADSNLRPSKRAVADPCFSPSDNIYIYIYIHTHTHIYM